MRDANVLISAAISQGPSHRIVQGWLQDQPFELVICDRLLGEVRSVLTERPGLRKWISMEAAGLYVDTLATSVDVQPDRPMAHRICRMAMTSAVLGAPAAA